MISTNYNCIIKCRTKGEYDSYTELIEAWDGIASLVEEGYDYAEPELENDLFLRQQIQILLIDKDLRYYIEHKDFEEKISLIDKRLSALITAHPKIKVNEYANWWDNVLLIKGGVKYVSYIKDTYNIEIALS